jgi:hypothetical protein
MATPLSEFRQHVGPHVPKCPQIQIDKAITDAAVEFLKESRLLQQGLPAIDIVGGQSTYALANPTGFQIATVHSALYNGKKIGEMSEDSMDRNWLSISRHLEIDTGSSADDWRVMTTDSPGLFYQPTPNTIRLIGIPNASLTAGLVVTATVYPLPTAVADVDDWVYAEYYEGIAAGAIARLMAVPAQSWSNLKLVAYYRGLFDDSAGVARSRALRGYARDDQTILRTKAHV